MKKVISVLLILVLMLSQSVSFAATDKIYVEDDSKGLVEKLNALGIFEEFDQEIFFGDNKGITRSEAAVVISQMLGVKSPESGNTADIKFFDVPLYCDYIYAVNYVTDCGIMTANEAGMFRPDEEMAVGHIIKSMIVALGYGWKAEALGGYPQGYMKVASELKITKDFTKDLNEVATRLDFLKLVDIVLDKPICKIIGYRNDEVDFEIDKELNILSEYHDIYVDDAIVQNNKAMSLSGTVKNYNEEVLLGDTKVIVNGITNVYSYLGYEVTFYYKKDTTSGEHYLLYVSPTTENTIAYILQRDFMGFENNEISYNDAEGRVETLHLDQSVAVLHNGEVTVNVAGAINGYQGTLTVIDNNGDEIYDVVIANNYIYDKVKNIKVEDEKIYTDGKVILLADYDNVCITDKLTGNEASLSELAVGDIIGYAESTDKKNLILEIIGTGAAVSVERIADNRLVTDNGTEYSSELLRTAQKSLIKPGATVSLVVVDDYYAVWADSVSEAVSIGYLIALGETSSLGETRLEGIKILEPGGEVKIYKPANQEKIVLNDMQLKTSLLRKKLSDVKLAYGLGGDGEVSQVISYRVNEKGELTHLYTLEEGSHAKLYLKYSYINQGRVQIYDNGYSTARFGLMGSSNYSLNYSLTTKHPIFKVPAEGQDSADDKQFACSTYNEDEFEGGGESNDGWKLDSYVGTERGIVPKGVVVFMSNAETEITDEDMTGKQGKLLLVDKVYQAVDGEGEVKFVIEGIYKNKLEKYYIDTTAGNNIATIKANAWNAEEQPGFTVGDLACVALNNLGETVKVHKVYDCETRTINDIYKPYNGKTEADTDAYIVDGVRTDSWCIEIWSAYNFSEEGPMLETFSADLTQGVPGVESAKLMDLYSSIRTDKKLAFYDEAKEKVYAGDVVDIVDYHQDPAKYTIILVRHNNGWVWDNQIFYNYE